MIVPAVTVKLPLDAPAATATVPGTIRAALLLNTVIDTLAVTAFDRLTVHVAGAPDPREDGVHASEVSTAGLTRLNAADCVTPFNEAVTVAVPSA
ncbi:MAG: hypothetical protein IT166_17705, partial [Bryobacterales bacterium]|nr:hypothetical protein [Bryobacterales bacterium]